MGVTQVSEFNWGVYILKCDDLPVMDESGSHFCIASARGDLAKIKNLLDGGRSFGLENLSVEFLEGAMPLSEAEHEQQMEDLENGRVSRFDAGSYKDDITRAKRLNG